jgi:hypothetical protein
MKRSPEEQRQLDRLLPSRFSGPGFLGADTRPLEEIVLADLRECRALGVEPADLAHGLDRALQKARAGLGAPVELCPGATAVFHDSRGRVPSPFRGDGTFEKGEAVVTLSETKEGLTLTALGIHLIARRGFFQGRGAPYRIEPGAAFRLCQCLAEGGMA